MLRMGPDGTGDGGVDQNLARNDVMAETIKIVSTSVLGLTVGCAQCHAHRYDPISHADYHRIRALFEPAYDWKHWRAPDARLVSLWTRRSSPAGGGGRRRAEGRHRRAATRSSTRSSTRRSKRELAKLPEELQPLARAARETPAKERTTSSSSSSRNIRF